MTFRAPFLGISPAERARTARERIVNILERGGPGTVSVEKLEPGDAVKIDGALVFVLTRDDVDRLGRPDLRRARSRHAPQPRADDRRDAGGAQRAADARRGALGCRSDGRLPPVAVGAAPRRPRRHAPHAARSPTSTAGQLRIGGAEILQPRARAVASCGACCRSASGRSRSCSPTNGSVTSSSRFPYTRPWGEQLNAFLAGHDRRHADGGRDAMPDLLIAVVIFFAAHGVTAVLKSFFDGVQAGRIRGGWLDADSARPTRRLVAFAVWVFALVMAYPYHPGSGTEAFKGLSVLVGLMVSIGASGIVGQAASGLILMYTRTYPAGRIRPRRRARRHDRRDGDVHDAAAHRARRGAHAAELARARRRDEELFARRQGPGLRARHHGDDRLRRAVAAGARDADRGGAPHAPACWRIPPPRVFQTALSDFYVEYRLVCQAIPTEPRPRAEVLSVLTATCRTSSTSTACRSCRRTTRRSGARRRSCRRRSGTRRPRRRPRRSSAAAAASGALRSASVRVSLGLAPAGRALHRRRRASVRA